jgi:hypothetical protein
MAQLSMANWPIRSRSRLGAAALNTIPQEYIANDIPWPLIVEGRGSPWGIAIISNKQDRGSDPNDPANALQRAIFKAGADTSVGIGFDPKLPDNTLRVVVGDKTPSAPVIPTRIDATADPAKKQ